MTDLNQWTIKLTKVIQDNYINIDVISCIDNNENCELELMINNNIFNIISNFENYCYITSNIENIENLNLDIILNYEFLFTNNTYDNIFKILEYIYYYQFETKEIIENNKIYDDKYNFYNNIEEKTKFFIDFKLLQKNKSDTNIKDTNLKVPKELLLNKNQIFELLVNEIKIINNNFDYKHYIYPYENNIYDLRLRMFLKDIEYIEFKIIINPTVYPFVPPKFEIITPNIKLILKYSINNLEIFKLENWNPSISLDWIITNIYTSLDPIINDYILTDEEPAIQTLLLNLSYLTKLSIIEKIDFKFDVPKFINENKKESKNYWKSGTGYGNNSSTNWDIKNYIKEKELEKNDIARVLEQIDITDENINIILNSSLMNYLIIETSGINLLVIEDSKNIFDNIFRILHLLKKYIENININFINKIAENLENNHDELFNFYNSYTHYKKDNIIQVDDEYVNIMKNLQFDSCEIEPTHIFYKNLNYKIEQKSLLRILSEISSFKKGLPLNYDSTIWIRISKKNIHMFTFIISGPKDTPYENGLFEFHVCFPINYPNKEPSVLLKTTGNGTVRFNPNLYNNGKVCLSLLGTWNGSEEEKWNPQTSTFLQVLVSIQSLILVEEPYFNEPGYEKYIDTPQGIKKSKEYNKIIELATLQFAIIDQIENPPKGYENVVKEHFTRKKNDIINKIDKDYPDNEKFQEFKSKLLSIL